MLSDQVPRVLPARSLRVLADALPALYAATAVGELPRAFAELLVKIIPGDSCGVVIDDRGRMKRFWHLFPAAAEHELLPVLLASFREVGSRCCQDEKESGGTLAASDIRVARNIDRPALCDADCRRFGLEDDLSIQVQHGEVLIRAAVWRRGRGFRPEERALMNALRPHFKQAWANAHCFAQLAAASSITRGEAVATWTTEPLEVRYGLTPREGEVLIWVAQGKTNPEVAAILGVQPSTVRTHLERVFAKLGVETRHAAGLRAIEVLGMPAA